MTDQLARITRKDIEEVKRQHILANLLSDPKEVASMFCVSVKTIFRLIEEGELIRANGKLNSGRTRITAQSVERYRIKITANGK